MRTRLYQNLPNLVSILGILPLGLLLLPGSFPYLIPLIIYNNFMDDLDGVLAVRLDLKSRFGAVLDNVCDVVAHVIFVLAVGAEFGGLCAVAAIGASISIVLRITSRLEAPPKSPRGTATNELIRHVLFILLLASISNFNASMVLIIAFLLHGVSMQVQFGFPHLIRSMTRSPAAIASVNLALLIAWLVPTTTALIAACFVASYLYSFVGGGYKYLYPSVKSVG